MKEFVGRLKEHWIRFVRQRELQELSWAYTSHLKMMQKSEGWKRYCLEVQAINFIGHNLLGPQALALFEESLKKDPHRILSLGAGLADEWRFRRPACLFVGVDIAKREGTIHGEHITQDFMLFDQGHFDFVYAFDSLYGTLPIKAFCLKLQKLLSKEGEALLFHSFNNLSMFDKFAKALSHCQLSYEILDLTSEELLLVETGLKRSEEIASWFYKGDVLWERRRKELFKIKRLHEQGQRRRVAIKIHHGL